MQLAWLQGTSLHLISIHTVNLKTHLDLINQGNMVI